MKKLSDHIASLAHKPVLVRCNFDVPIENGQVLDTTRIEDAKQTIHALQQVGASVRLIAHAGRPDGKYQASFSLQPITQVLSSILKAPITFIDYQQMSQWPQLPADQIILFDNLRFFSGEEENHSQFTDQLAQYAQAYVNECFATAHRQHASIVGLPNTLPSYLGYSFAHEIEVFAGLKNPRQPLVVVLGGAKLETKKPMIEKFQPIADKILVGGKIALDLLDHPHTQYPNVHIAESKESGKDITEATARSFAESILQAGTVVWNGTMGVFEEPQHMQGTRIVAQAVNSTAAYTIVGGGDTESALTQLDQEANIDHISSGGGAMLTYISTGKLAALEALKSHD